MKSILLSIVLICSFYCCTAQNLSWLHKINEGSSSSWDNLSTTDKSGNVYYAGYFSQKLVVDGQEYYPDSMYQGYYIVKYSAAGQQQWVRIIMSGTELRGLMTDDEGNLIVTVYSHGSIGFEDNYVYQPKWGFLGRGDAFIIKFSSSGQRLWVQSSTKPPDTPTGNMGDETYPYGGSQVDKEGNIYQLGTFYAVLSFDSTVVYGEMYRPYPYMAKIDKNGKLVWLKSLQLIGFPLGYSIMRDELVFSMYIADKFAPDKRRYALMKWDLNGNVTMDRTIKNDSTLATTTTTSNDNFIYLSTVVYLKKDTLDESFQRISISKLDRAGNIIWERSFTKQPQEYWFSFDALYADKQDNLYISGRGPTYVWDIDSEKYARIDRFTVKAGDRFIAKMNVDGAIEWLQVFKRGSGVYPTSVVPYGQQSVIFAGNLQGEKVSVLDSTYYSINNWHGFVGLFNYSAVPSIPASGKPVLAPLQEYTIINPVTDTITNHLYALDTTRYEIKTTNNAAEQPANGRLLWKGRYFCYQPNQGFQGVDSFNIQVCAKNSTTCAPVKFRINVKDPLEILKRRSFIKPDSLLSLNLLSCLNDPNKGLMQLYPDSIHWPANGFTDLYIDGEFQYSPKQGFVGIDTIGVNICSYSPDFPNDVPACRFLNYEIIVSLITGLPDNPVTEQETVRFFPNPAVQEAQTYLSNADYAQARIFVVDLKGGMHNLKFEYSGNKLTIFRGELPAGMYVVCIKVKNKVYTGKVVFI